MNYKQEMIFPIIMLALTLVILTFQLTAGLKLDIDLKGGTQITGSFQRSVNIGDLQRILTPYNANVRTSTSLTGATTVFIGVESSINTTDVINTLANNNYILNRDYSIQTVGSALGSAFFQQAIFVLLFAFLFMGVTVFIIFKIPLPSFYVTLCGFADTIETLVISQLIGIPLSLAVFTSLLLLLGYSVDTDILLTTRVYKTEGGDVGSKVKGAMKTGITMVGATLVALAALFIISTSPVISQIASILLIGLVLDIANTWFLNAPLLRMYMERKAK